MSVSRRHFLAGAAATAAVGTLGGSAMTERTTRQPVVYLPHGGGPWPFVQGLGTPADWAGLRRYLGDLPSVPTSPPKAILVISAHWEAARPTVMVNERPPMLYDYYGFPEAAYRVTWPAPGSPALAGRVRALLGSAGIDSDEVHDRGFDHGTFVPLKVAWPQADVPTVQLSLVQGLDPATHLAVGRALAPLRDEGVFIVGSGMSYHHMRGFGTAKGRADSDAFDAWLGDVVARDPEARDAALVRWADAPAARACHPREEHLLPLMVVAGAAGADRGSVPFRDVMLNTTVSAVHFG